MRTGHNLIACNQANRSEPQKCAKEEATNSLACVSSPKTGAQISRLISKYRAGFLFQGGLLRGKLGNGGSWLGGVLDHAGRHHGQLDVSLDSQQRDLVQGFEPVPELQQVKSIHRHLEHRLLTQDLDLELLPGEEGEAPLPLLGPPAPVQTGVPHHCFLIKPGVEVEHGVCASQKIKVESDWVLSGLSSDGDQQSRH